MTLKELQKLLPDGQLKKFTSRCFRDGVGHTVLYSNASAVRNVLTPESVAVLDNLKWSKVCIIASGSGAPNRCFYMNWGIEGDPTKQVTLKFKSLNTKG